jgi:hypothetical protein
MFLIFRLLSAEGHGGQKEGAKKAPRMPMLYCFDSHWRALFSARKLSSFALPISFSLASIAACALPQSDGGASSVLERRSWRLHHWLQLQGR